MLFAFITTLLVFVAAGSIIIKQINSQNKIMILMAIAIGIGVLTILKTFLNGFYELVFVSKPMQQTHEMDQNFFIPIQKEFEASDQYVLHWIKDSLKVDSEEFQQSMIFLFSNSSKQVLSSALKSLAINLNQSGRKAYFKTIEKDIEIPLYSLQTKILNEQIQENAFFIIDDLGLAISATFEKYPNFNTTVPILKCTICDNMIEIWKQSQITLIFASSSPLSLLYFKQYNKYVKYIEIEQDERMQSIYNQLNNPNKMEQDLNQILTEINSEIDQKIKKDI